VEADPEWAPHLDLGKQLATLHGLLVDSLPKLPAGKIQVSKRYLSRFFIMYSTYIHTYHLRFLSKGSRGI
jgi:hypothetical protein